MSEPNYNKYVDEIREIRTRHYEKTKNMTPEERRKSDNEEVEAFRALFGRIGTTRQNLTGVAVNPDKYIDEIHEIRQRIMEETEHMTPEERREYIRKGAEEFERMVAQRRAEKSSAN